MDTDLLTKEEKEFDMALENVPEEVQDFMWSDAYTIILDAIQKTVNITNEQKDKIRTESYDLLVGLKSMTEIAQELLKDMSPDLVAKILYIIDTEIITRAENITEFYTETPEETEGGIASNVTNISKLPNTVDMFDQLKQNLVQPTTFAPTKRIYDSVGSPQVTPKPLSTPLRSENSAGQATIPPSASSGQVPKIDPYRELPKE